jgi:hypothetical protein
MSQDETKKKKIEIEKIYEEYMTKMNELKKEQDLILADFLQTLEKAKMKEAQNKLKN